MNDWCSLRADLQLLIDILDYAALIMPLIWRTATESVPLFRQQVHEMLENEFPEAFSEGGSVD